MMHIVEPTREERLAVYMRLTKKELVEMLMTNQDALAKIPPRSSWYQGFPSPSYPPNTCVGNS